MKKLILFALLVLVGSASFAQLGMPYSKAGADATFVKKTDLIDGNPIIDAKADSAGQEYTGVHNFTGATITAPTKAIGTNTTDVATMAALQTAIIQSGIGRKIFPLSTGTYAFPYTSAAVTTENDVVTFTIPAGSVGIWGSVHLILEASCINTAVVKTVRVKMNGLQVGVTTITSATGTRQYYKFDLQGALNGNVECSNYAAGSGLFTSGGSTSFSYRAVNFASDVTVTITCQTASASELITIHSCPTIVYY